MNTRIKKKKCIQYMKSHTIKNAKNFSTAPTMMTAGGDTINERYRYMIKQRTRANAYHETMIKWSRWFTMR